MFLVSMFIHIFLTMIGFSFYFDQSKKDSNLLSITKIIFFYIILPILILWIMFLIGMCIFHLYLKIMGKTTKEVLKHKKTVNSDLEITKNDFCCCITSKSLFNPRM